ncbi:glutamine amidotransferase [Acerihabitans sp. KWT182]|uniref:Glutamine amidotransferase n=1 Tax=Acerihabitans sp. KWT182 TaxID=3157919 RepID=A0AAU7QAS5_9GAMM
MGVAFYAPLAIVQMGEPPAAIAAEVGEQYRWFVDRLGLQESEYVLIRPYRGDRLPEPDEISAAIITGSWSMVTDHAPWSEITAAWIRGVHALERPLLGICYGHQLIAYALGGTVADNPRGWEGGLQQVRMTASTDGCPLLEGLPRQFAVWLSHLQTVLRPPAEAQVLAVSPQDDCQIIRYSPYTFSLQFHPEFSRPLMASCLRHSTRDGARERLAALPSLEEPEWPSLILRRFYENWRSSRGGLADSNAA